MFWWPKETWRRTVLNDLKIRGLRHQTAQRGLSEWEFDDESESLTTRVRVRVWRRECEFDDESDLPGGPLIWCSGSPTPLSTAMTRHPSRGSNLILISRDPRFCGGKMQLLKKSIHWKIYSKCGIIIFKKMKHRVERNNILSTFGFKTYIIKKRMQKAISFFMELWARETSEMLQYLLNSIKSTLSTVNYVCLTRFYTIVSLIFSPHTSCQSYF